MKDLMGKLTAVKGSQWLLLLLALSLTLWAFMPDQKAQSAAMTTDEARIAQLLSRIERAGETQVVIFYEEESTTYGSSTQIPTGALVVSQGAHDLTVQLRLHLAVQTLLSLPADAVQVFPMEESP